VLIPTTIAFIGELATGLGIQVSGVTNPTGGCRLGADESAQAREAKDNDENFAHFNFPHSHLSCLLPHHFAARRA